MAPGEPGPSPESLQHCQNILHKLVLINPKDPDPIVIFDLATLIILRNNAQQISILCDHTVNELARLAHLKPRSRFGFWSRYYVSEDLRHAFLLHLYKCNFPLNQICLCWDASQTVTIAERFRDGKGSLT